MSIDNPICQYCGSLMEKKGSWGSLYYKCPTCGEDSSDLPEDDDEDEGE